MTSSTLFILAGFRGVGKSTVCATALQKKTALFGEKWDGLFQQIQIPSHYPEWEIPFEQLLAEKTWFGDSNLNPLASHHELINPLLFQIDILSLLSNRHCYPNLTLPSPLSDKTEQAFDALANPQINEYAFEQYLSHTFFKRYDNIIVNTLYAPWQITANQYEKRKGLAFQPHLFPDFYFHLRQNGESIYESIYQSWLIAAQRILKPTEMLISKVTDQQLLIKRL